jgi:hypothetical protein
MPVRRCWLDRTCLLSGAACDMLTSILETFCWRSTSCVLNEARVSIVASITANLVLLECTTSCRETSWTCPAAGAATDTSSCFYNLAISFVALFSVPAMLVTSFVVTFTDFAVPVWTAPAFSSRRKLLSPAEARPIPPLPLLLPCLVQAGIPSTFGLPRHSASLPLQLVYVRHLVRRL